MEGKKSKARKVMHREPPKSISGFLSFLFAQIREQRRWALLPLWVLLALVGLLLFLSGGPNLLPASYLAF